MFTFSAERRSKGSHHPGKSIRQRWEPGRAPRSPSLTWQAVGVLWQQVLVGIEQSCVRDHDGAIDVHQLLTLLHTDTCRHKNLTEVLCTPGERGSCPKQVSPRLGFIFSDLSVRWACPRQSCKMSKTSSSTLSVPQHSVLTFPSFLSTLHGLPFL